MLGEFESFLGDEQYGFKGSLVSSQAVTILITKLEPLFQFKNKQVALSRHSHSSLHCTEIVPGNIEKQPVCDCKLDWEHNSLCKLSLANQAEA